MIPYLGNFKEDETVYVMFNTFSSDDPSASCTITNFANTDVHIHKDDGLTQRNNAAGITVSIDFDGITGSHLIKIDTSDDTVAGFWVTGKDYFVRIEGTTVDGATINAMVGHFSIENRFNEVDLTHILGTALTESVGGYLAAAFKKLFDVATPLLVASDAMRGTDNAALASGVNMTQISGDSGAADNLEAMFDGTGYTEDSAPSTQEQVGRLTSGTAAVNTIAESFTKAGAEPETGTYTNTQELNGVVHKVEDDAGSTDAYYEFDVGGNGVPVSIIWQGYAQSQGDSYSIWAYNYGATTYEQIGSVSCVNNTTIVEKTFLLSNAHVGTGANIGKVRFRFLSTDGTAFATDRLLCSYAIVTKSTGYSDGAIWVNTNGSNTNTENYVDGTADNPVSTWDAAKALSASMNIKKFHIINGSDITLDSNSDNYTFVGFEYALALGGQSLENVHIEEANVSGIATSGSGTIHFHRCKIGTVTLGKSYFTDCGFDGTVTVSAANTYIFEDCYNAADGGTPPIFDFGGAIGNTHIGGRNWQGGIEIKNLGANGVDVFSFTGNGSVIIDSTCVGGTIKLAGMQTITDNVSGGFVGTLVENARYDVDQINAECDTALSDYGANTVVPDAAGVAPTVSEIRAEMDSNSTKLSAIETDTQDIQSRIPAALSGGNIKADVLAISGSTDAADHLEASAETIVVGAAVTGTLSTTQMTTDLTEATNDHYNGRIIIWTSGVLKDQATDVTDYDGATKKLIYTATTEAPSDGDTFVLV